jgi:hypothetical protein
MADYPQRQSISFHYDGVAEPTWAINGPELDLGSQPVDVVWLRRPVPPALPDTLHPEDRYVARIENGFFNKSLWHVLASDAKWVNSYQGHLAARSKLLQLREASKAGLVIPPTLVSNDPDTIVEFIDTNLPRKTIYKSFYPARWDLDRGRAAILETTVVEAQSLPSPDVMRLTPGIFQPLIEKTFEIRATFFGAHVIALRLHSQKSQRGKIDCRAIPMNQLQAEPYQLPAEIYRGCRRLMASLGIVFGCFDFIVTPDKGFVFLEVNEMGQFLWKDHVCPETRILDAFLDFLGNPSPDFTWRPHEKHISLDAVVDSADYQALREEETVQHVESSPDSFSLVA